MILQTDSYKQYHWTMRIHDTTRTVLVSVQPDWGQVPLEHGSLAGQDGGRRYREGPRVTRADIEEALDCLRGALQIPAVETEVAPHRGEPTAGGCLCGFWPGMRVAASRSGSSTFTVVNKISRCEALGNHVEALLCKVWYPMTVATVSGYVIGELLELVKAKRRAGCHPL